MVVWAVDLLTVEAMFALLFLKEVGVILLLLPAVRLPALVHLGAPLGVGCDDAVCVPGLTHLARVGVELRLAPVVLPIVRVDAGFAVVVVFLVRAPHGLEVEKVKVHVDCVLLDQLDGQLTLAMCKRAVFFILTRVFYAWVEVAVAKLRLVLVRMIELFNPIVRTVARISIGTHHRD